ncbi:D-arabinono-1,4-lactone oxidase [Spongiibacter marinus]|uniref:D-arabinono-1,4-lactone oxidase n=1 Tax=Spongiibacter marinus TaxID=354246 RepID=UPI0004181121|nr:D-arabinono-1,4-lactone oxidase [Spongiibacter marinus]
MAVTRRTVLKQLSTAAALGAVTSWSPVSAAARRRRLIPWSNWSGGQRCIPAQRVAPTSEAAIADLLENSRGVVRPVGASHSFSALVPTDGTLVSLAQLTGMIGHNPDTLEAEFWAGTPMSQMGQPLHEAGQALVNMADIDYQTLAGAIATSTHGTGIDYGSYSAYVSGLRLITASGDVLDCDAENNPEIFSAARVSLGALGVITRIRMKNRQPFRVHEQTWVQDTNELLEDVDRLRRENDRFEFIPILHSDVSLCVTLNETNDPKTLPKEGGGDGDKVGLLRSVHKYAGSFPNARASLVNTLAKQMDFPDVIDQSYKVFANVRDQRFNEMEYTVPAEAGPDCLREIMALVRKKNLNSFLPLEYRYIKADDIPLSMFSGRDGCAISVHQSYELDYHNFFAAVEPIFWKYEGRPHWGKLHSLNAAQLSKLYPQWQDFTALREELDPDGRFLNGHLASVFGTRMRN